MPVLEVAGRPIEYQLIRSGAQPGCSIVMLHEGLGSLAMWRDFPGLVAHATQCDVLVYSRFGYGQSAPLDAPYAVDYLHREALQVLPELLDLLHIVQPVLLGHSDGASIALIHAGGAGRPLAGVIAMAPHVLVEDMTILGVAAAKEAYRYTDLPRRLAPYHANGDAAFRAWNRIWLDPGFRDWNIEEYLPAITCPILAIQGEDDEYASMNQIERIARQAVRAGDVDLLRLEDCRHSPHRDQPQAVIAAITRFIDRLAAPAPDRESR
ncbi:MAG: alpha/beta hydrolase [Rhodocyclaceae bacterium]